MTEIAVTGVGGQMGGEVLAAAAERDDLDAVLAFSRTPDAVSADGLPVVDEAEFTDRITDRSPDIVVDFTVPEASRRYVSACVDAGVAAVVGTTGFGDEFAELAAAGEHVPVCHAPNFARGVAALRQSLREAVRALPDADVEVTETHHRRKRDAPSGTARALLDDIDTARGRDHQRVHGRAGDDPADDNEVGVHARRAGAVAGEHEVLLADGAETVTLAHRAESRRVFADGALDTAAWLAGRPAGSYAFSEVLA